MKGFLDDLQKGEFNDFNLEEVGFSAMDSHEMDDKDDYLLPQTI